MVQKYKTQKYCYPIMSFTGASVIIFWPWSSKCTCLCSVVLTEAGVCVVLLLCQLLYVSSQGAGEGRRLVQKEYFVLLVSKPASSWAAVGKSSSLWTDAPSQDGLQLLPSHSTAIPVPQRLVSALQEVPSSLPCWLSLCPRGVSCSLQLLFL